MGEEQEYTKFTGQTVQEKTVSSCEYLMAGQLLYYSTRVSDEIRPCLFLNKESTIQWLKGFENMHLHNRMHFL